MQYFQEGGGAQFDDLTADELKQKRGDIIEQLAALAYIRPVGVQDMVLSADRAALIAGYLVVINYELGQRGISLTPNPSPRVSHRDRPVEGSQTDAAKAGTYAALIAENQAAIEAASALLARKAAEKATGGVLAADKSTDKAGLVPTKTGKLEWAIHPHPGGENWHVALLKEDEKFIVKPVGSQGKWIAQSWIAGTCAWVSVEYSTVWKAREAAQKHWDMGAA